MALVLGLVTAVLALVMLLILLFLALVTAALALVTAVVLALVKAVLRQMEIKGNTFLKIEQPRITEKHKFLYKTLEFL